MQDDITNDRVIKYESPFGKDRTRHLQMINRELQKQINGVEDFVQKNNEEIRHHNDSLSSERIQTQQQTLKEITPQKYTPKPILQNHSEVQQQTRRSYPPKTPGTVYDDNNNPVLSNYVSTYDTQHSHMLKQEQSKLAHSLNSINEMYLKSLQKKVQQPYQQSSVRQQPVVQNTSNQDTQAQLDWQQQQLDLYNQQQQQQEQLRQQQLYLQQQQQQQEMERIRQEKEMRERLDAERRRQTENQQTQTLPETENRAIQHVDHNSLTATEYTQSLKNLSGSVIDLKNRFIAEQNKLNHQLIQMRDSSQREIEEKLRIQDELRQLEEKHRKFKVWEGEKQRQLIQAMNKNAPIANLRSHPLDYTQMNPSIQKLVRFNDQTIGYEYDEPNAVMSKSNLVPFDYNQRTLHNLKQEAPFNPEEYEQVSEQTVPKLNYSNDVTKALRVDDLQKQFYDYRYNNQMSQQNDVIYEDQPYTRIQDPNRVLLENDRRLHELNIIDPNSERQQLQELYDYI